MALAELSALDDSFPASGYPKNTVRPHKIQVMVLPRSNAHPCVHHAPDIDGHTASLFDQVTVDLADNSCSHEK